jgi:antitoxin component YwqK of YwqJK toxin-antitoxin module
MLKKISFFALVTLFIACESIEQKTETDSNGIKYVYSVDKKTKLREGAFTKFFANGTKYEEGSYRKDSLHGEHRFYHENGNVQIIENYNNGRWEGSYKEYYDNNILEQEGQYANNEMTGEWKTFYSNGTLKETVMFAKNLENGPFKEFQANGKLKAEVFFRNGEFEEGELKEYTLNGELKRIAQCGGGICRTTWAADTTQFINR